MKKRALYLIKTYLLTVLIFIIAKLVFMLCNQDGHPFTVGDIFDVITHGLTLDLSTALYFLIVPFLVTIISIYWWKKILIQILTVYHVIIAIAFSLAFVADTSLYEFWQFKLDASCLQYLETPTEAMASVSWWYVVLRLVIFLLVALLIYIAFQAIVRQLRTVSPTASDWKSAGFGLLAFLVSIPIFIIGIRGGLGESTTNIGQVYFSNRQFLNHSAVNPVFSFLASLEKTGSFVPEYKFMEEDERARLMDGIYPTKSVDTDTLLRSNRPNVVIILLESCGGIFTEEIGGRKEIMPNLNRYVHEGVYFSQFYANSYRTDRGTLCTLSGYPSFPQSSVMKMPAKTRFLPGIAKSLRDSADYQTSYLYGGDINFTNMRGYLVMTGFDNLYWQKDYTLEEQRSAKWGVRDDITFGTLSEQIARFKTDEHYLIGYSTLSSHQPWDVPTHGLDDEIPNAFNYLDQCIGNFIEKVRKTPQWNNLLVILLPDHGFTYFGVDEDHEMHDHVPMLWLGGAIKEPRRIDVFCNQTDLPATLLGQMGLPHDDFTFSRDVMSRNYTYPFAVHTYNNGITMKDSTGFAVYDLNAKSIIVDKSTNSEALVRRGMAILQTASEHINQLGMQ